MIRVLSRLVICATLLLSFNANAETYSCITNTYPPLVTLGGAHSPGLAVEVVERVFRQIGHTLRMEMLPPTRALATMQAGKADCVFVLFSVEKWHEEFLDIARYSIVPQVFHFFATRNTAADFNGDLESVTAFRIGTAQKTYYGSRFESVRSKMAVDEAPTIEQSLLKLAAGRVDLVLGNVDTVATILATPPMRRYAKTIVILPTPVESAPTYVAFSKPRKLTRLREEFEVALKTFVASHEYRLLLAKYGVYRSPHPAAAINDRSD